MAVFYIKKDEHMNRKSDYMDGDISLFHRTYPVRIYDLDMNMKVTMPVMCRYFQEIGITHGTMVVENAGISNSDIVFVLTRLQVKMDEYPTIGDEITIETWLSPIVDKYVVRNFLVCNKSGKLIGTGMNSAVPFSMKERKAGVLPANLDKVQTLDRKLPVHHSFEKINLPDKFNLQREVNVGYYDCDLYRHANNTRYIEWCLESLSPEYNKTNRLYEIDINFRAEANAGEKVVSRAQESAPDSGIFCHVINTEAGDRDYLKMNSVWSR